MKKISLIALAGTALLLAACTGSVATETDTGANTSSAAMEQTSSEGAVMEASSSVAMEASSSDASSEGAMVEGTVEAGTSMSAGIAE